MLPEVLRRARLVFWDFDGVIKESLDIKADAFARLFQAHGEEVRSRVRAHHAAHGGMSRYEKIPIYLRFAGEAVTDARVAELCERFAQLVRQAVIDAPWVPGAERLLRENPLGQDFVVVSATPQDEMEGILEALRLRSRIAAVHGAPRSKAEAIRLEIARAGVAPAACVMVGDARADLEAARANAVPFLLRVHATNQDLFADYDGPRIRNLTE
jgi:phosphoglycolate phosphatase-like HAD superfamily hydrolase